jgi:UDP-glucose 4-epimerase
MQASNHNKILVTGGAGYIGSHTVVELLNAGYDPIIVDNFANSKPTVCDRISVITGHKPIFIEADCRDKAILRNIFTAYQINAVIHFAGLKAVGESIEKPILYYDNNVGSSIALLEVMAEFGVKKMVFSSSAIVYGDPAAIPIKEDFPKSPANPYGRTKLMIEEMLRDLHAADPEWQIVILRYFNSVGAHPSGLIGEDPVGIPNNLMPYISQVAAGKLQCLNIFGNDYDTPDGTGIRDYIHVVDLAVAHLKALEAINGISLAVYNIGTGRGYSVLELVRTFENSTSRKIPYRIVSRRPGDIAVCYADSSLAVRELNWRAHRGIDTMCADTWRWQSQNRDL